MIIVKIIIMYIFLFFISKIFISKRIIDLINAIYILFISALIILNKIPMLLSLLILIIFVVLMCTIKLIFNEEKYYMIINKGKLNIFEFIRSNISFNYLIKSIRANYKSIKDVDTALVYNRKVYFYNNDMTLIINESKIVKKNLYKINKDETWILNNIREDINNIKIGIYKKDQLYIIKRKI